MGSINKNKCEILITLLFAIILLSGQRVYGDVNDLVAQSLSVLKEIKAVNVLKTEAASEQIKRIYEIESQLKELRPEIVREYKSRIKNYRSEIDMLKKKIAELELKITSFQNKDPNDNEAIEAPLEVELNGLRAQQQEIADPFDRELEQIKLKSITPDKKAAYKKAMEKYCLIPGKPYEDVVKTRTGGGFGRDIFSYSWVNSKGKQVAWSHIRLRDKHSIRLGANKIDGKYDITTHSTNSIWVWAGHFYICFVVDEQKWQGKEQVGEAVQKFIDLKGLAAIDASPKPDLGKK